MLGISYQLLFWQFEVALSFRYHKKIFLDFWDPPTTKKKKSENFTCEVLGIKIG